MRISFVFPVLVAFAVACGEPPPPAPVAPPPPPSAAPVASSAPKASEPPIPAEWPYPVDGPEVKNDKGMVTSDASIATKVGADVLASGGDAVEAAIATAFALAVVFPTAGNIGGGGFLVARVGGKDTALDFREAAPAKASRDMFKGKDGKPTDASRTTALASGVPGSVAGLYEAYQKLAGKKKTWAELLAPAIKLAKDGFTIDDAFVKSASRAEKVIKRFPATEKMFYPNGAPPPVGSTLKNPDLAAALERIAQKGPAGFYEGKTAELIAKTMKKEKGLITTADLKGYKAKWRPPIAFDYRGHHVVSMPPPSSGGIVLAMLAHQLEAYDLKKLGFHSPAHVHLLIEAMRRAYLARNTGLGDPDFVKNPIEELLSKAWADKNRASIKDDHATPTRALVGEGQLKTPGADGPHTTHYSVSDAAGNVVAVTTTLNGWFGSGLMVEGAGFVLNNEMDDFTTVPGSPNMFGLIQGESNAVGPGKRMLSSMAPSVVLGPDGKVALVLGAAGGPTITTSVFQILSNVLDFGMTVTGAANAPRLHHQDFPEVAMLEKNGFSPALKAALEAMGHKVDERDHVADAPTLGARGGVWIGAPEARRAGSLAKGP